jgi:hypothetical protein
MLSQPATKVFFKTSEPRAAKWVSETLGEIEVERLKESRTPQVIGSHKSFSMEITTKPLIMASEIAGLEPLHGFVKQENKVVPVNFAYVGKRSLQPAFIERKMTIREPRPLPSIVVPELSPVVIPPPKEIQVPATEAAPLPATHRVPQIAAAVPDVVPAPALPLVAEAMSTESTEPEPRKSAFKKKEGAAREWKPLD